MIKIGFVSTFLLIGLFSLQYMLAEQYKPQTQISVPSAIPVVNAAYQQPVKIIYVYADSATIKETCTLPTEPQCQRL